MGTGEVAGFGRLRTRVLASAAVLFGSLAVLGSGLPAAAKDADAKIAFDTELGWPDELSAPAGGIPAQPVPAEPEGPATQAPANEPTLLDLADFDGYDLAGLHRRTAGSQTALERAIELQKAVSANGMALGEVTLRIDPETSILSLQLDQLLDLFGRQLPEEELAALRSDRTADDFVSFSRLRAAGFAINFDPVKDMLIISTSFNS